MGISKSKESYNVSTLETKIEEENAYGSIREEAPSLYSQFSRNSNEKDLDVINKGETRKEKIIRFGPEKRKSITTRDRVPSNTPVNEEDEKILKEIVEKVKSGGAVVLAKSDGEESERRCSIDENPVAPIEQLIEDFERKSREDSMRRRGSYLGHIYNKNEKKDSVEKISSDKNDTEKIKVEEEKYSGDVEVDQQQDVDGVENKTPKKDPLEADDETKFDVVPQRRVSYRDKAEFFSEVVPRKDSIENQPLGHRQSIKENLIEEFNSSLHGIETNRTEFVHSMLQGNNGGDSNTVEISGEKDPLDIDEQSERISRVAERKKSDPLDIMEKPARNGQTTDDSFNEIQEIMNRDFEKVKPISESVSYVEYSTTTIVSSNDYPLNVVDTQKQKSKYELKEEKQIPLNTIREIKTDATKLRKTVEEFEGRKDDVQYVYLNEMLLRCLIKLDSVNVGEDDLLKQERKNVVDYVQECIRLLDDRTEGDEPDIEISF